MYECHNKNLLIWSAPILLAQFFLLLAFSKKVGFAEEQNMNGNLMIIAALLHFVLCRTRLLLLFFLSNLLFPFLERDEKFLCFFEPDMFSRELKLCWGFSGYWEKIGVWSRASLKFNFSWVFCLFWNFQDFNFLGHRTDQTQPIRLIYVNQV